MDSLLNYFLFFKPSFFKPLLKSLFRRARSYYNVGKVSAGCGDIAGGANIGPGVVIGTTRGFSTKRKLSIGDYTNISIDHDKKALRAPEISLGFKVKVGSRNQIAVRSGERLEIGDYSTTHSNCHLFGNVSIGRYCLLSSNIFASTGDHNFSNRPAMYIRDQDRLANRIANEFILVEDDCWIGWGVVLKKNITIGRGSIIGANSVVTSDVPPYSVFAGAPAKLIKSRLAFIPPRKLAAGLVESLPYLYRGFKSSEKEIVQIDEVPYFTLSRFNYAVFERFSHSFLTLKLWSKETTHIRVQIGNRFKQLGLVNGSNNILLNVSELETVAKDITLPHMNDYTVLLIEVDEFANKNDLILFRYAELS